MVFFFTMFVTVVSHAGESHGGVLAELQDDYTISSWTPADGLPPGPVRSLAQDRRGFLWVGTDSGLYRFDGLQFTPWRPIGSLLKGKPQIRALLVTHDGDLWAGLGGPGGVAQLDLSTGTARDWSERDGLPRSTVDALVEDARGTLWMTSGGGLFSRVSTGWKRWNHHGLPAAPVLAVHADQGGRLLVVSGGSILRFSHTEARFETVAAADEETRDVVESDSGALYVTDPVGEFKDIVTLRPPSAARGRGSRLLTGRDGALWVGTAGQGLWRWRRDPVSGELSPSRSTALTGLLADGIAALFEDRDRNIWVGTPVGLNRLTLRQVQLIPGLLLVAGPEATLDGSLCTGTIDEVLCFPGETAGEPTIRLPLHGSLLRAIHSDEHGTLWIATNRYLAHVVGRAIVPVQTTGAFPRRIDNLTSDFHGGVVAYDRNMGLLRWINGRFHKVALPAFLESVAVVSTFTDTAGVPWLTFADGHVATMPPTGDLIVHDDLGSDIHGPYYAILEDRSGVVWLSGQPGLTKYANSQFKTLHRDRGLFSNNITALAEDLSGNLWLGTAAGISYITRAEVAKAFVDPAYQPVYTSFDRSDGLAGLPLPYSSNRRSIRRSGGSLWFLTGQGITIVNPATMMIDRPAPKAYIQAIRSDQRTFGEEPSSMLPAGTRRIDIEYSALAITSSSKTQFQYKLEPFDLGWVEAGPLRQASYTHLPAGHYSFVVRSRTGDGHWSQASAAWHFGINRAFYQTLWFSVSVSALLCFSVWLVWRSHVNSVRREFSLLLRERVRLGGVIHDTLLQNMVSLALQFDAAATNTEFAEEWVRRQLIRWRKQVESYIDEARDSIGELRSVELRSLEPERRALPTLLGEYCQQSASNKRAGFVEFHLKGLPRLSSANVDEQVFRVGQEAVLNAIRHANASHVDVELEYSDLSLCLTVRDDGTGFDCECVPSVIDRHYGLSILRERVASVGGEVDLESAVGRGTTVRVLVPLQRP